MWNGDGIDAPKKFPGEGFKRPWPPCEAGASEAKDHAD